MANKIPRIRKRIIEIPDKKYKFSDPTYIEYPEYEHKLKEFDQVLKVTIGEKEKEHKIKRALLYLLNAKLPTTRILRVEIIEKLLDTKRTKRK